MKKALEYILIAILALLCIYTAYKSYTLKDKVEYITTTDTIQLTDTITDWQPYDIYHYRTDTAYLPVIDTILDTIVKTDSILVEVPIYRYIYDTIIKDTNYETHLNAILSGFNTSIDTLTIHTEIMPQQPKKAPWYSNICPCVGVGFGTGGAGVFVGVGYKIF